MIYSRWGCLVEVTAYCGKHKVPGYAFPLMLVRANRSDPDKPAEPKEVKHYFASSLRADNGINEIESAIDAAPEVSIAGKELRAAIADAE